MKLKRTGAVVAAIFAGALVLSACSTPEPPAIDATPTPDVTDPAVDPTDEPFDGFRTVTVAWNDSFRSQNNLTAAGNATANANILYITNPGFFYFNQDLEVTFRDGFGSIEVIGEDPLTVKATINEGVVWSDGTPIDAADMILFWGAQNAMHNTATQERDEDGNLIPIPDDQVFFSGTTPHMGLITEFPEISDDGRSITVVWNETRSDWLFGFDALPPVSAHAVAMMALGIDDPMEAKDALVAAFRDNDTAALAPISQVWNTGFDFVSMPSNPLVHLSSGPFVISEFEEGQYLILSRNPLYTWGPIPIVDEIIVRFIADANAMVTALQNEEVDLIAPQMTPDIILALEALDPEDVTFSTGVEATWEHITLVQNNAGPFDPATYGGNAEVARLVRIAFLQLIPREQIVNTLIRPLQANAEVRQSFNFVPSSANYAYVIANNGSDFFQGDPAVAADLLAQARELYPNLPDVIDVRLLTASDNPRRVNQFQMIAAALEGNGFNLVDSMSPAPEWGQRAFSGDGSFDAALFGWQSTSTALLNGEANYITGGQNNFGGFSVPEVDALWAQIRPAVDDQSPEITSIAAEMESYLFSQGFGLPIFQFPGVVANTARLQNAGTITLSPTIFWNFWMWDVTS